MPPEMGVFCYQKISKILDKKENKMDKKITLYKKDFKTFEEFWSHIIKINDAKSVYLLVVRKLWNKMQEESKVTFDALEYVSYI
jgi:hypothetical protein